MRLGQLIGPQSGLFNVDSGPRLVVSAIHSLDLASVNGHHLGSNEISLSVRASVYIAVYEDSMQSNMISSVKTNSLVIEPANIS
jgi:hypothetical protein